jgi:hypothetical protein
MNGMIATVKIGLILAVTVLAIVGTLYVLDVFTTEAAKEIFVKLMKIVGLWTGACLVVLALVFMGPKNTKSS